MIDANLCQWCDLINFCVNLGRSQCKIAPVFVYLLNVLRWWNLCGAFVVLRLVKNTLYFGFQCFFFGSVGVRTYGSDYRVFIWIRSSEYKQKHGIEYCTFGGSLPIDSTEIDDTYSLEWFLFADRSMRCREEFLSQLILINNNRIFNSYSPFLVLPRGQHWFGITAGITPPQWQTQCLAIILPLSCVRYQPMTDVMSNPFT